MFEKRRIAGLLALAILISSIFTAFIPSGAMAAPPSGYQYMKTHTITGSTGGALSNYQTKVVIHSGSGTDSGIHVYLNGHSYSSLNDIRFANSADGLLDYWVESNDGSTAVIWVEMDSVPVSPNTYTMKIYYGKSGDSSASNGAATFPLFDDFNDGWIDTGKWTVACGGSGGSVVESGGVITLQTGGSGNARLSSKTSFNYPIQITTGFKSFNTINYERVRFSGSNSLQNPCGYDIGIFEQGPMQVYWNGFTGITVPWDNWYTSYETFTPSSTYAWYIPGAYGGNSGSTTKTSLTPEFGVGGFPSQSGGTDSGGMTIDYTYVRKYAAQDVSHGAWSTEAAIIPTASFTASPVSGQNPLSVTFTDASTGNSLSGWSWNFGDGQTSTERNPTHVYQNAGAYTVTLTVTNAYGGSNTMTRTNYISVSQHAPVASFTSNPTIGQNPLTVQFTSTSNLYGTAATYSWNFGDGQASTAQNPSHIYTNAGTYTVTLIVTNTAGSSTTTATITVSQHPPAASFTTSATSGLNPLTVTFTDTSSLYNAAATYQWNFGDGQASTERNPTHVYQNAGTYTAKLTVTTSGGSNTAQTTITVNQRPPIASFTSSATTGMNPLTVTLTDTSSLYGATATYQWSFGDGTVNSTSQSPSHTFQYAGTYTVRLTVTTSGGSSSTQTTITVNQRPPVAGFTMSRESAGVQTDITFTDNSEIYDAQSVTLSWNFGDGTTATGPVAVHKYYSDGIFIVTQTVTTPGGTSTAQQTITSFYLAPVPAFHGDNINGTAPLVTQFYDDSLNVPTSWHWDFGDGGSSNEKNPKHTFVMPGTYTVTLYVKNPGTAKDTWIAKTGYVAVLAYYVSTVTPQPTLKPGSNITDRPKTNQTIALLDMGLFNKTMNDLFGSGNTDNIHPEEVSSDAVTPYVDALGPLFWVILFGAIAVGIYIKTESLMYPGIAVLASGGLFFWLLPFEWQNAAWLFVILGVTLMILGFLIRRR
ncbi:DUF2341 domain-containing protein [Methanocella sp. MCL-LM]|uniref:DUF2341 domain-containing protein n=1 Tax=Methanocella sp. MCL-LM TaxID=3412035 RepID=UPI003C775B40